MYSSKKLLLKLEINSVFKTINDMAFVEDYILFHF